ncbi:hypothetical protein SAY86_031075 [Trapa natans]|uniref:LOB domain-containing protein n=1 Tax=Trapa natans TaxID=22666 RepID=A0AAN7M666_TRANT|nr:hypothetical protein SAY86_031075 [Trapa natans]
MKDKYEEREGIVIEHSKSKTIGGCRAVRPQSRSGKRIPAVGFDEAVFTSRKPGVLRKPGAGCGLRFVIQWIKSPESQANATVFLAKFYGRAGLMNLINTGPEQLRPAIFRSLLYEACGRIVNPIYGSVGLLWSGNWALCQSAVESVLKGTSITPINDDAATTGSGPPLKAYDIRHVSKDDKSATATATAVSKDLHRLKTRCRFKGSDDTKPKANSTDEKPHPDAAPVADHSRSTSHDSSLSHPPEPGTNLDGDSKDNESMVSEETAEQDLFGSDVVSAPVEAEAEAEATADADAEETHRTAEVGLELSLGLEPVARTPLVVPVKKRKFEEFVAATEVKDDCGMELGL